MSSNKFILSGAGTGRVFHRNDQKRKDNAMSEKKEAEKNLGIINQILKPFGLGLEISEIPIKRSDFNRNPEITISNRNGKRHINTTPAGDTAAGTNKTGTTFNDILDTIEGMIDSDEEDSTEDIHSCTDDSIKDPAFRAERIFFNGKDTTIAWEDGTKTKVTCAEGDTYSREAGIAFAYMKKLIGNNGHVLHKLLKPAEDKNNIQLTKAEKKAARTERIKKAKKKAAAAAKDAAVRTSKPKTDKKTGSETAGTKTAEK